MFDAFKRHLPFLIGIIVLGVLALGYVVTKY
ncbi:Uncharacterised protein [Slackia heliotrinireducens]|nr:Uncharacterised protein [Slackia heliotrinireducens]